MEVLHGHTSPETAFIQTNYPFGRRVRCVQIYYVETATKGAKKGEQRMVSITTRKDWNFRYSDMIEADGQAAADAWALSTVQNSLTGANDVPWNAPKGGNYYPMTFMYRDDIGHIHPQAISWYHGAEEFIANRRAWFEQFDDEQKKRFEAMERASRKVNPESWAKAEQAVTV